MNFKCLKLLLISLMILSRVSFADPVKRMSDFQLNQWYVTKCFPYFYMPKKAFWMRFAVKFTQKDASTKKGNPYANHTVEIRHYNNHNEIVYQKMDKIT